MWKHFASLHNQNKDNNQSKNNKQPEVTEKQTAWNSDNEGIKETFTQTDRRDGDRKWAPQWRGRVARLRTMQIGQELNHPTGHVAEWETKDSKLAVNYCRGCHGGRHSQSHRREFVGKWG